MASCENADVPIFLSIAGPTTKGPMPSESSLNFISVLFIAIA